MIPLFTILICLLVQSSCGEQPLKKDLEGSWLGILPIDGSDKKVHVIFDIEKQDSIYSIVMHDPDNLSMNNFTTIQINDSIRIKTKNFDISYSGIQKNDTLIEGIYSQMNYRKEVKLIKQNPPLTFARPQTPTREDINYMREIAIIENPKAKGVELDGILSYPKNGTDLPAVILIAGSGALDKEETIANHKTFLVLSHYLVNKGIAVLCYDKRGAGKSTGNHIMATTEDFASDVEAAIEYLKTKKNINKEKIGLIGHSEGGVIAFMLAAKRHDLDFIISMAGVGVKGEDLFRVQSQRLFSEYNASDSVREVNNMIYERAEEIAATVPFESIGKNLEKYISQILEGRQDLMDNKMSRQQVGKTLFQIALPWSQFMMKYDPTENLKKITCPVFAINGEKDMQVVADSNLSVIDSLIKSNGNKDVTIKKYPGLNHLFQHCQTGAMSEYAWIEETISPEVLDDMGDWILQRVK